MIEEDYPIAYLSESQSAVYFSINSADAGSFNTAKGTALPVRQMQNQLKVAYWGEDNRFPQNIEQQMAHCGVGKAALEFKARQLWGSGILPGIIKGYEDEGKREIFEPLDRVRFKNVYSFLEQRSLFRFFLEYLQDWVWYGNCFPEIILSKDTKTITGLVHQESNDCRFKQMDESGKISKVYLSKLWGANSTQYAKFDPEKKLRGIVDTDREPIEVDNKYVKALDVIDMYDAVESLKSIAKNLKSKKGLLSAILPTNYPSPNKTYYQVTAWDGARLGGWVEIAAKIPSLFKRIFNKAFRIRYHIQIPDTYFEKKYGSEVWRSLKGGEKATKRKEVLKEMDEFLTGDKNAYKTFLSVFDVDPITKKEYGQIKIDKLDDKIDVDKEIIMSSTADAQFLIAAGVHPALFGAGVIGTGAQRTGGSDQREAFLVSNALLNLERNVALEPLYLVRDYNGWDSDIVFRIRDTVLTTLDKGKGTEKTVS